jgi:3-deoxy-7-phosphoheptulonate synthase
LIVEVHCDPEHALSDGMQSLFPSDFETLVKEAGAIASVLGKTIAKPMPIEAAAASR